MAVQPTHRQNRVTPFGDIESTPARGLFMGNRGDLFRVDGTIGRRFKQRFWITCTREEIFGKKVIFDQPGRYTPLFFLDEATALAAGHRPCAMCRRKAYNRFRVCWQEAGLGPNVGFLSSKVMDDKMHAARIGADGTKVLYRANLQTLPDGAFILTEPSGEPRMVWNRQIWRWTHFGYQDPLDIQSSADVMVITPRPIVDVLAAGYVPVVHSSIDANSEI